MKKKVKTIKVKKDYLDGFKFTVDVKVQPPIKEEWKEDILDRKEMVERMERLAKVFDHNGMTWRFQATNK